MEEVSWALKYWLEVMSGHVHMQKIGKLFSPPAKTREN